LPTPLFAPLARRLLQVDPRARSSMADDLARGRPTEIDALCGEVVRLAAALRARAPRNERMVQLVHGAERAGGSPGVSGAELRRAIVAAR